MNSDYTDDTLLKTYNGCEIQNKLFTNRYFHTTDLKLPLSVTVHLMIDLLSLYSTGESPGGEGVGSGLSPSDPRSSVEITKF